MESKFLKCSKTCARY